MKLFSTRCETLYLGWDAPLLPRGARLLGERFARGKVWDLASLVCVLPSTRAVARLETLLRQHAAEHQLRLALPTIITVGQLPEMLYESSSPVALELEQTLGWTSVLRSIEADRLTPLISQLPSADSIGPWLELAGTLRRLHEDLAASRLTFRDVVALAETQAERRRWLLLTDLHERYLASMKEAGLADPHQARREAIASERCQINKRIVLIGTTDLSEVLVAMLRSLPGELMALVAAPQDESERFNEFGSVIPTHWLDHQLPLEDEQLLPAGDAADQAAAVAECLAEFADQRSADEVTVGVTDESLVGPVEIELRSCGVPSYRHLGWTVDETAVGRLFDLTATYLLRRDWQSLAALVRHADVYELVSQTLTSEHSDSDSSTADVAEDGVDDAWLVQLDQLRAEHFPVNVNDRLPAAARKNFPDAVQVARWIEDWLSRFVGEDRSIASWSNVIVEWLSEIYGGDESSRPERTALAVASVRRWLGRYAELNDQLDLHVGGAAAMEALSARLADLRITHPPSPEEVEILGWLDLSLDDAPAMVVVGLNHPFVPAATTNDPFLPGSLRTRLRMADNDRRYARDVHAMHLMISTRAALRMIVGKRAADGSPTPPSRLLAAADSDAIARRTKRLLSVPREPVAVTRRWTPSATTQLPVPKLSIQSSAGGDQPISPVTSLSVTAFRDYLTCPYRFYLRHVLKLKPLDDASQELAANQFGDLVHAALERFGLSDDRDQADEAKIESLLSEHLDAYANEVYGDSVSTAVQIQIAQAHRRLRVVAQRQAERIAAGWRIHACEASVSDSDGAGIEVNGQWMGLKGRFDRIDRHSDGRWAILDYKTHGHRPEKKHLQKTSDGERWIDLQLPLYRMMVPYLGIDVDPREVELGYFNIAEKDEETRINLAEFSESQMREAERLIHDCVARIQAGDFAPTGDRVQFDDYGMILQTGVADQLLDQSEATLEGAEA